MNSTVSQVVVIRLGRSLSAWERLELLGRKLNTTEHEWRVVRGHVSSGAWYRSPDQGVISITLTRLLTPREEFKLRLAGPELDRPALEKWLSHHFLAQGVTGVEWKEYRLLEKRC